MLIQNNTQNTHFVHIFIVLADNLSNCLLFNCLQKCLKCWPMNMGSARRHFLHSLIAALITFCSRLHQSLLEFINIPECYAYLGDMLLHNSRTL